MAGPVMNALLRVRDLSIRFDVHPTIRGRAAAVAAVRDVSLDVEAGEVVGIVGESGAGKSSVGLAIVRSLPLAAGTISFDGRDVTNLKGKALRQYRRHVQMVFQDPYGSLPPRMRVADVVTEPLVIHGELTEHRRDTHRRNDIAGQLLESCGLPADAGHGYPEDFSGGQRQRIAIARAIALQPRLLVADEPTSALDVSVQAQILELLQSLRARHGLALILISHNLAVVRNVAHHVVVMRAGQIVETAPTDALYDNPRHPYTRALLRSVPVLSPEIERRNRHLRRLEQRQHETHQQEVDANTSNRSPTALVEVNHGHWVRC